MSVRLIATLNSYDRWMAMKAINEIATNAFKAGTAFNNNDEVTLELALSLIDDKVRKIREVIRY